ncbi:MAG: UDP-3-O-(3-hydroxymyristoyl)glucosamine N-acyltransferase [Chitinophagia bacterium]|nr:UDP-3-O-(3-hydroxymyristoyl)glucosamine N-acyltransferase [Chitinophagia bacterium]
MQFTARQIAILLKGNLIGNPDNTVTHVAKIEEATAGSLCFIANPKYEEYLYTTYASVVIVNNELDITQPVTPTVIKVEDAYSSFALLLEHYNKMQAANKRGVEQPSYIAATAQIGENAYIGAFSYIADNVKLGENVEIYPGSYIGKNTIIGNNVKIYPGVKIYDDTHIGNDVVVHSGTVIGSDGFGFAPLQNGAYKKLAQIGNVVIEDDVEIGANTTIDRATMGSTVIKKGVKLDNLIQIAHNAEVGEHTVIAAQTGVSGSTKVGSHCLIGGQVGMVGHISIANGTKINAQSGISKSVTTPYTVLNSSPAFDYKSSLKSQAVFRHLPEMQARLNKLEETVQELLSLLSTQKNVS